MKLKKGEYLTYAGTTALRAPDGTPLPAVPQYMITRDSSGISLQKNERLILVGHAFTDKKKAEERFAALQAGRKAPAREVGTPLYVIDDVEKVDANAQEQHCITQALAKDLAELFSVYAREMEAAEGR